MKTTKTTTGSTRRKAPVSKPAAGEVPVKVERGGLPSLIDFNFQDLEKLFHDFFMRSPLRASSWSLPDFDELRQQMKTTQLPNIDVVDRRNEVMVRAELPGCDKDDVQISVADGRISIRARHVEEKEEKDASFLRKEISSRQYQRTVPVPPGVDLAAASAEMKRGVLRIHLPKKPETAPRKLEIH